MPTLDPLLLSFAALLSLALLLAYRLNLVQRRRRQFEMKRLHVYVSLQRLRRQTADEAAGPDRLARAAFERLRRQMDHRQRRRWDAAMTDYLAAQTQRDADAATSGIDRLLELSAPR